jgi:Asp-tRNA(Asn)/Glu-tRNA(Gln) amidotransferase A subunit family amidase
VTRAITASVGGDAGHPGVRGPMTLPDAKKPARLAMLKTTGWDVAAEEAKAALAGACDALRAAGIEIVDARSHDGVAAAEAAIEDATPLSRRINAWEGHWPLNTYARDMDRSKLSASAQGRLEQAQAMNQEQYQDLLAERDAIRATYEALRSEADLCITLSAPGAAPVGLDWTGDPIFTVPTSLLGVPSLTLPVLRDEGLPLGLQLFGYIQRDAELFATAGAIDSLFNS